MAGVLDVGVRAAEVRAHEEAGEEEGQGEEVENVQPDGERLAGGVHAGEGAGLQGVANFLVVQSGLHGLCAVDTEKGAVRVGDVPSDALSASGAKGQFLQPGQRVARAARGKWSRGVAGSQIDRMRDRDGHGVVDKEVHGGEGAADDKLDDLHRGQGALDAVGDADADGREGVVGVHERVDERVEDGKDPDRGRHVADARPHAHHGAGMVVRLQGRAFLSLCEDDDGVEDLVELGQVEQPAEEGEARVPQTAHIHRVRRVAIGELVLRVQHGPLVAVLVVDGGVPETSRPVDLAQRVDGIHETMSITGQRRAKGLRHADKGPRGIHGQKDIVQYNEQLEQARLADGPRLVVAGLVDAVEQDDGDGVDGGDSYRDADVEGGRPHIGGDVERLQPRVLDGRRRERRWVRGGRELEERLWGESKPDLEQVGAVRGRRDAHVVDVRCAMCDVM